MAKGIKIWATDVKNIYIGSTACKEVFVWTTKVRPTIIPKTFTITWVEKTNMSSWWTYSDDAAWLTAGSTAFDEFFDYSVVRLNTSWAETSEVKQTILWQLDFSQLGTLTSGDNVMIKFPVRWIKMSKSWSTVTLSITNELNKSGYQYYAHSTWTLSSPWTPKNAFYLWAFKASNNGSNVLKSRSGKSPEVSQTEATFCTRAKANGSGYNIIWYYQRQFVNALYMMKYGNPNSQSVVWLWYAGWYVPVNTWWTVSQTSATYWTTSNTQQAKLFWLEDWWGNINEWVWWAYTDWYKNLIVQLSWYSWAVSGWESTWSTIQNTWTAYNLSSIVWNNKVLFWPSATNGTNYGSDYYCDFVEVSGSRLVYAGGPCGSGTSVGTFYLGAVRNASSSSSVLGSRLLYL